MSGGSGGERKVQSVNSVFEGVCSALDPGDALAQSFRSPPAEKGNQSPA